MARTHAHTHMHALAHTDLYAGGYLREVLTAKVYDVAVETPLQRADKLRWGRWGGWAGGVVVFIECLPL